MFKTGLDQTQDFHNIKAEANKKPIHIHTNGKILSKNT